MLRVSRSWLLLAEGQVKLIFIKPSMCPSGVNVCHEVFNFKETCRMVFPLLITKFTPKNTDEKNAELGITVP